MGLFGKKDKEKKANDLFVYDITMTQDGKLKDDPGKTFRIEEESEFLAVRAAEKKNPHLKVAKVVEIKG